MSEALSKYRLKKDLYAIRPDKFDPYQLVTKEELDDAIVLQHSAGDVYEFDEEMEQMTGPGGEIGVDKSEDRLSIILDPDLWDSYVPLTLKPGTVYDVTGPNGEEITGTFDRLTGTALINGVAVNENGEREPEYAGTTEVHWNDQVNTFEGGERLYIDSDACMWRESQLVYTERADEHAEYINEQQCVIGITESNGGHCD
jgi:hypothetical protein